MRVTLVLMTVCAAGCNGSGLLAGLAPDGAAAIDLRLLPDSAAPRDLSPSPWPRRIALRSSFGGPGDNLRLVDGTVGPQPADLRLQITRLLLLAGPGDGAVCAKGTFATLAAVPLDQAGCPSALSLGWERYLPLGAAALHGSDHSEAAGVSALVRDAGHAALYQLRVISDAYQPTEATVVLEYQPAP